MRVALLTTGYTELMGLAATLHRLFPGHDFQVIPQLPDPSRPFAGITSNRLPAPSIGVPDAADKLAQAAVSLVDPDRPDPHDLALVLDDLELTNLDQPALVIETFARKVFEHIACCTTDDDRRARLHTAARDRISFHLAVPMIEAWFFADPAGPARAGVPSGTTVCFDPTQHDAEGFHTDDPAYLAATEDDCPCWRRKKIRKHRPKWWGAGDRSRHPKGYLQWLTIDGAAPGCTRYLESREGVAALEGLSWADVLCYRRRCTYARALIHDLSEALGQQPQLEQWQGERADATQLHLGDQNRTIRNH
ncbi:MAG: hypothetical protein ABIO70_11955 [Pseudomonadota bacterium]